MSEFELKTKELEIDGNKYVIKEFDFETFNEIESAQVNVQLLANGKPHATFTPNKAKYIAIQKGVVEAPFDTNDLEFIKHEVPGKILQKLYMEILDFNQLTQKKSES